MMMMMIYKRLLNQYNTSVFVPNGLLLLQFFSVFSLLCCKNSAVFFSNFFGISKFFFFVFFLFFSCSFSARQIAPKSNSAKQLSRYSLFEFFFWPFLCTHTAFESINTNREILSLVFRDRSLAFSRFNSLRKKEKKSDRTHISSLISALPPIITHKSTI